MARRPRNCQWNCGLTIGVLILCGLIRFAVFAPISNYWSHTTKHDNLFRKYELLRNGTYSAEIVTGEKIADIAGTFCFFWNFVVWLPSFWFPPPLNLPFTAADIAVAVLLIMATSYQTGYSPHSKRACDPVRNADFRNMHRPLGTDESLFEAMARLDSLLTTPKRMCETFVEEWQYGIALSLFYVLISLLNIIAFVVSYRDAKKAGQSLRGMTLETIKGSFVVLRGVVRFLWLTCIAFLYYLPQLVFRCLPLSFKAPVRIGRRHVVKAALGMEQQTEMKVMKLTTDVSKMRSEKKRYRGGDGAGTPLAEFLSIYDMLILVTEQLHYIDMVNLSRVSKSVRESVLPLQDYDRRISVFKLYTCHGSEKWRCWMCENQICKTCSQRPLIPLTTLLHHLDYCTPYCTPCYNTRIARHRTPPSERLKRPYCDCAPRPANPNLYMRFMKGSSHYKSYQASLPKKAREVCRNCNLHNDMELLALRERRTIKELQEGRRSANGQVWSKCSRVTCGRDLGTGPRWWICTRIGGCGKECTSWVHGQWGSKSGENKDKSTTGEEAV
ncbi:hypothetical protein BKA66DRAFT_191732 [Pyrenochaeta sp. MPI-SDFR-AT-0127]|nr:hypothetical protein BKA66DRAFT_191732 [Pyrenochaeta sp. MPI-SDFR-AT-0127]